MTMESNAYLSADIVFNAKPDAIPYNYRISYKVSQLCLIMSICGWGTGRACSLIKLHMISFALISRDYMKKLIAFAEGENQTPIVRFDPAVNKALTYAMAYGFIEQQKVGNFILTDCGKQLSGQILLTDDLMVSETEDLNNLAKKLTETRVKQLVDMWRDKNAAD